MGTAGRDLLLAERGGLIDDYIDGVAEYHQIRDELGLGEAGARENPGTLELFASLTELVGNNLELATTYVGVLKFVGTDKTAAIDRVREIETTIVDNLYDVDVISSAAHQEAKKTLKSDRGVKAKAREFMELFGAILPQTDTIVVLPSDIPGGNGDSAGPATTSTSLADEASAQTAPPKKPPEAGPDKPLPIKPSPKPENGSSVEAPTPKDHGARRAQVWESSGGRDKSKTNVFKEQLQDFIGRGGSDFPPVIETGPEIRLARLAIIDFPEMPKVRREELQKDIDEAVNNLRSR